MDNDALARVVDAEIVLNEGMTMVVGPQEAKKRLMELQSFVKSVMHRGEDFGLIPGVKKPCLFKPGAEKLSEIYGLVPSYIVDTATEDWDKTFFYYRIRCQLRRGDRPVSEGLGSCNSREDRYAWRWSDEKYLPPGIDKSLLRKKKGKWGWTFRIPNDDLCSQANTILKMAKKRAFVDAVITATRSSGLFTQDVEDLPAEDEVEPEQSPMEEQLDAAIVAEQDKLAALFETDLKRADSEDKVMGVGQLIAQAHAGKKITDDHRKKLRGVFADVSKAFR
jgi:hypothetical protein